MLRLIAGEDPELSARFFAADGEPRLTASFVREICKPQAVGNVRELRAILWESMAHSQADALEWFGKVLPSDEASAVDSTERTCAELQSALDDNNGSLEKTWRALGPNARAMQLAVRELFPDSQLPAAPKKPEPLAIEPATVPEQSLSPVEVVGAKFPEPRWKLRTELVGPAPSTSPRITRTSVTKRAMPATSAPPSSSTTSAPSQPPVSPPARQDTDSVLERRW